MLSPTAVLRQHIQQAQTLLPVSPCPQLVLALNVSARNLQTATLPISRCTLCCAAVISSVQGCVRSHLYLQG